MVDNGWRTVILENPSHLSVENDCLVITGPEEKKQIALEQIGVLVINNIRITMSTTVFVELSRQNIKLIMCNEKYVPFCELIPYYGNSLITAGFRKQIAWTEAAKEEVWQQIVCAKIRNQAELIKSVDEDAYTMLLSYLRQVKPNDIDNRESQAARVYFNALFGKTFRRRDDTNINSALNYGYAIILSTVSRFVSIYGYHTAIGIHHCSADNPYNLSCDLMEPFRPLIDQYVYKNRERALDFEYKKELISLLYSKVKFGGTMMTVMGAIEIYVKNILDRMSDEACTVKELEIGA